MHFTQAPSFVKAGPEKATLPKWTITRDFSQVSVVQNSQYFQFFLSRKAPKKKRKEKKNLATTKELKTILVLRSNAPFSPRGLGTSGWDAQFKA